MGQVVPFITRVRDSGDWSASERSRLEELADRLAANGVHVEVIFGATDEGDPWCVVTDQDGDVLIHVARIDGRFVVHSTVDDSVSEGGDLHAALRERLDATEEAVAPQSATILPFNLAGRQGQTFLALVVAAAFFYETAGIGGEAEAAEAPAAPPPPPEDPPPASEHEDAPAQERQLAVQGAALQEQDVAPTQAVVVAADAQAPEPAAAAQVETPPPAPLEVQARARAEPTAVPITQSVPVIEGTAGNDSLVGTAADEHLRGGEGNDTLRGGGGHDTLDGGAGDDRIEITADSVAIGGAGADTFVIATPVQLGHAGTLLGVVFDFSQLDGDRFVSLFGGVRFIGPPRPPSGDDKVAPPTGSDFGTTGSPPTAGDNGFAGVNPGGPPTLVGPPPLTRQDIDLDGDGIVDGYILVGSHHGAPADNAAILTVGQSLGPADPLG